jgi:CBS domain-containing protein
MKAADVMISSVITVGPNASVQEVAKILLANRISALPVVDEQGNLLGIVSEGDLLRRVEADTEYRHSWFAEQFGSKRSLAADYVKSHSRKAADIMTRRVITATLDTPLHEIATLLEKNAIKRVPIVVGGKIAGIVSRANFLQILARNAKKSPAGTHVQDSKIRRSVIAQLNAQPWRPSMLNVTVQDGVVDLWGLVNTEEERKAARVAVELMPGVKAVTDNLSIPPASIGMA